MLFFRLAGLNPRWPETVTVVANARTDGADTRPIGHLHWVPVGHGPDGRRRPWRPRLRLRPFDPDALIPTIAHVLGAKGHGQDRRR